MTTADDATRSPRPGGRTARVRADVHAALEQELAANGYDNLTIEAVAAASGVHRTTIYRRWGSVAGLLVDLLAAGADDSWEPADTGSLESDLIRLNREVRDAFVQQPSLTAAVVAASFRTAEAADALTGFWQDRYARSAIVVTRAIDRGEIPPETDAQRLLMASTAPVYHQLVLLRQPMTRAASDRAAKDAAAAAKAGIYRLQTP
jgi:AcrR family transcriptional regulator